WTAIYYKWKNVSRNIRKAIAREDPIGVLATVIRKFEAKLDGIDENITQAVAALKRQKESIRQARQQADESFALVEQARRQGKSDAQIGMYAAGAGRWQR